ncbi:hypothetical protein BDN71DRAFT_1451689 [Pleurotus eryngii]|uniref:Uncharacterized protein n=1 Tax=Pleurotus eryngii TaxID=5323 RepID=A0A9P5ZQW0_PLEER|nr:hypothetical protein BDN71DRAFT_1451689 [Pleurotus eryngii]
MYKHRLYTCFKNIKTDRRPTTTTTDTKSSHERVSTGNIVTSSSAKSHRGYGVGGVGGNHDEIEVGLDTLHSALHHPGVHSASAVYTPQVKGTERRHPKPDSQNRNTGSQSHQNPNPQGSKPISRVEVKPHIGRQGHAGNIWHRLLPLLGRIFRK